jgi:hypothetical protein
VIDPNYKKLQPCFAPIKIKTKTKKRSGKPCLLFLGPFSAASTSAFSLLPPHSKTRPPSGDGNLTKEKKQDYDQNKRERERERERGLTRKGSWWRGMRETS